MSRSGRTIGRSGRIGRLMADLRVLTERHKVRVDPRIYEQARPHMSLDTTRPDSVHETMRALRVLQSGQRTGEVSPDVAVAFQSNRELPKMWAKRVDRLSAGGVGGESGLAQARVVGLRSDHCFLSEDGVALRNQLDKVWRELSIGRDLQSVNPMTVLENLSERERLVGEMRPESLERWRGILEVLVDRVSRDFGLTREETTFRVAAHGWHGFHTIAILLSLGVKVVSQETARMQAKMMGLFGQDYGFDVAQAEGRFILSPVDDNVLSMHHPSKIISHATIWEHPSMYLENLVEYMGHNEYFIIQSGLQDTMATLRERADFVEIFRRRELSYLDYVIPSAWIVNGTAFGIYRYEPYRGARIPFRVGR